MGWIEPSLMVCPSRGVSMPRSGSGSSEFWTALELYSAHSLEERGIRWMIRVIFVF